MKSAFLLAKSTSFFEDFKKYLKKVDGGYEEAPNSIKLTLDSGATFMFYDRMDDNLFEKYEMPKNDRSKEFRYGYLVECKSEIAFCEIVGSPTSDLDFLVCDSNGDLYRPDELSPDTIVL